MRSTMPCVVGCGSSEAGSTPRWRRYTPTATRRRGWSNATTWAQRRQMALPSRSVARPRVSGARFAVAAAVALPCLAASGRDGDPSGPDAAHPYGPGGAGVLARGALIVADDERLLAETEAARAIADRAVSCRTGTASWRPTRVTTAAICRAARPREATMIDPGPSR